MTVKIIVLVVGLWMNFLPTFHVVRMLKEKSSKGQSLIASFGLILGFTSWLTYGFYISDFVLIVTNSVGLLVSIVYFSVTLYFKVSYDNNK